MKIYTIGYSGRTIEELKAITDSHNGGILDIRYSPRSRRPEWSKKRLTALYGNLYLHLWEWGNELYNQGEIQLADFTEGLRVFKGIEEDAKAAEWNGAIFLMCACKEYDRCHRRQVAELLREHGYEVKEYGED